jgi:hypothetical protein
MRRGKIERKKGEEKEKKRKEIAVWQFAFRHVMHSFSQSLGFPTSSPSSSSSFTLGDLQCDCLGLDGKHRTAEKRRSGNEEQILRRGRKAPNFSGKVKKNVENLNNREQEAERRKVSIARARVFFSLGGELISKRVLLVGVTVLGKTTS